MLAVRRRVHARTAGGMLAVRVVHAQTAGAKPDRRCPACSAILEGGAAGGEVGFIRGYLDRIARLEKEIRRLKEARASSPAHHRFRTLSFPFPCIF